MSLHQTTDVVKGKLYRFRYRAQNCHGWGPLSPTLYALAATFPEAPPSATVVSISASAVSLRVYPTHDNGGTVVTNYRLYRNQGDGDSSTLTEITTYSYSSNGFLATITLADEAMTAGLFYQFSYLAVNKVGDSELSSVLTVPIGDVPAQPTGLARTSSAKTSIGVVWDQSFDTQTPAGKITGYRLYMDNGLHGDYDLVYDGEGVLTVVTYEAMDLDTGHPYRFYTLALNHVGESAPSEVTQIFACDKPSGLSAPTKVSVSKTSVTVKWTQPSDDGGCPIASYGILRDGGPSDDTFVEVHASEVNDHPSLDEFTVTDLPADIVGEQIKIKMQTFNIGGYSSQSEEVLVVTISDKPSAPTNGPVSVTDITTIDRIRVVYEEPDNGGSPITNFEI